jgi:hypothetical protein
VAILIALAIVAWLSKDALKQYGLLSGLGPADKAAPATERVRGPGAGVTEASPDITAATPAPINALERARGVEGMVKEQAAENAKRIDDTTK